MNEKAKALFKNLNYTVTANFLVLGISVILNLVVPKFIGVSEYGYWQLYIFYSSYVGFFHFGWIDGIYLKIGGENYGDLDTRKLGTQFKYLFIFELLLGIGLLGYASLFVSDFNRQMIWYAVASMLVISNLRSFTLFILQSTNRIKEYAQLSRYDRYLYLIAAMGYLLLGGRNFLILVSLDVLSKLIVTLWGFSYIEEIVFSEKSSFSEIRGEIQENIRIGSNLMLANIASMLILGFSRLFVEHRWDIETFGKLSFALSISNMFMIFISAVSVVLYPVLRRANQRNISNLYLRVRELFVPFTLGLLLLFNPIRILLEWWLPEYQSSLFFMGMLFPMIIYEGRLTLLVNTYLKTIRQEKLILFSNIITLFISFIAAYLSVYSFKSINLVVLSIIFSLGFRCILAESMLANVLEISLKKENIIETCLIIVFILGNLFLNNIFSFLVYCIFLIIYILMNYHITKKSMEYFLSLVRTVK